MKQRGPSIPLSLDGSLHFTVLAYAHVCTALIFAHESVSRLALTQYKYV